MGLYAAGDYIYCGPHNRPAIFACDVAMVTHLVLAEWIIADTTYVRCIEVLLLRFIQLCTLMWVTFGFACLVICSTVCASIVKELGFITFKWFLT